MPPNPLPSPIPFFPPPIQATPVRVVLVPQKHGRCVAYCLEFDMVEEGEGYIGALGNWVSAFGGHVQSDRNDNVAPLHNVPAPPKPNTKNPQSPNYHPDLNQLWANASALPGTITIAPFEITVRLLESGGQHGN